MTKFFRLSILFILVYKSTAEAFNLGGLWQKTEKETITKEYQVSEKSTITIYNTEGSITVKPWPHQKIAIEALKTGSAQEQKSTTVAAKASGKEAHITTRLTPEQKSAKIDYTIMVPEDASVKITQTTGPVKIKGIHGSIDVSLEKGSIDIVDSRKTVSARTNHGDVSIFQKVLNGSGSINAQVAFKGNIALHLPRDVRAQLYAKVNQGIITTDRKVKFEKTMALNKSSWEQAAKELECALGTETDTTLAHVPPIILEASSKGNITLKEY